MKKKVNSLLLCLCLIVTVFSGMFSASAASNDIVILYTNDVHTYINNTVTDKETNTTKPGLSYDSIAALKEDIATNETPNVLLVDAGDHVQGTAYGAMDKGQSIIKLMNLAGYDLATIGNHEFDYNMDGMFNAVNAAEFPYVSCNFTDLKTNKPVFDSYKIFDMGGKKVAFVGITTPEAYTTTSPKYFDDADGNQRYGFLNSSDGSLLYNAVQKSIDSAKAEGADYVIALAHLGIDESTSPYTSYDVIKNTTGFNAVIDGHSHSTVESENVTDKSGKSVVLTQTGNYLANVGKLTISEDGTISTKLINSYDNFNPTVRAAKDEWVAKIDEKLGEKIADSAIDLKTTDENGNRIVRIMECSMGDFVTDAYYYYINEVEGINCDVTIANGGGVRADISAGGVTYKDMKNVSPFGNVICIVKVTGQQILDVLEWGSRSTDGTLDSVELGAFMQTAGVSFVVDTSVKSTVQIKNDELWGGSPTGEYRVKELKIFNKTKNCYEPIDLDREYTLAGINYTLRNKGDGCDTLFDSAKLVKDYILEDYLVTSAYAKAFADTNGDGVPDISTQSSPLKKYSGYLLNYDTPYGSGRITIKDYSSDNPAIDNPSIDDSTTDKPVTDNPSTNNPATDNTTTNNTTKDNTATGNPATDNIAESPKTGDDSYVVICMLIMATSAVGLFYTVKKKQYSVTQK